LSRGSTHAPDTDSAPTQEPAPTYRQSRKPGMLQSGRVNKSVRDHPSDHMDEHGPRWQQDHQAHARLEYRGKGGNASSRYLDPGERAPSANSHAAHMSHISLVQKSRHAPVLPAGIREYPSDRPLWQGPEYGNDWSDSELPIASETADTSSWLAKKSSGGGE
jgi:hypothetical protein